MSPADTAAATCFPSQMQRHLQVHGAGSFGHFQASQYGVARGGHDPAAAVRGFVETRRSVTQLNHAVVSALVDAGVPAVGLSPCGTWSCSGRQLQDASPGIAAVQAALQHGLVSSVGMTTSPCAAVHTCYTYSCAAGARRAAATAPIQAPTAAAAPAVQQGVHAAHGICRASSSALCMCHPAGLPLTASSLPLLPSSAALPSCLPPSSSSTAHCIAPAGACAAWRLRIRCHPGRDHPQW